MKTKKIKQYIVASTLGCCTAVCGLSLSGCSDYLDVKPLNDVVLENYWTKKSDVTSVLMGCYESLQSSDCITRMGLWGEARSDNMILGNTTELDLQQMIKEDMLPTNKYSNWTAFYQTINRCNITIHYAPKVQEIDPNYTLSEMKANIAEATFIRTLCYFYLIRAFRDVPYSREPSIDDTQEYRIPADSFNVVLNNLIIDLEGVKDDAQLYFRKPNPDKYQEDAERDNTSRVTRPAVYALLADLYLWKGDWQKVVECCDYVINFKTKEYETLRRRLQNEVALFNDIPLYREKVDNLSGNAYDRIFGDGNSFESLFELSYDQTLNHDNQNGYVGSILGNMNNNSLSTGMLAPNDVFYGNLPQQASDLYTTGDCRAYESFLQVSSTQYLFAKYNATMVSIDNSRANWRPAYSLRSNNYINWIVYRLTDVMLMKAEALVQMGSDHFEEAFNLVNAVSKRAVNSFAPGAGEVLKFDDVKESPEAMEKLVMDERHRELMFEGKRWFDLLRQALRRGNSHELATIVTEKQTANIGGIRIRLGNMNALFLPYFRNELRVNPYLKQNPAYHTGGDADLNKN